MKPLLLTVAGLCLSSCAPVPESYKIPPQHDPSRVPVMSVDARESFLADDPASEQYLVRDVQGIEGGFRWTRSRPEFLFVLRSVKNRRFEMNFTIHDRTFRDTGPVTLVFFVNGNELDRVRYDTPGRRTFSKAVPEAWLKIGEGTTVRVDVLNPWNAPDPGVKLGFLLHRAGFPE